MGMDGSFYRVIPGIALGSVNTGGELKDQSEVNEGHNHHVTFIEARGDAAKESSHLVVFAAGRNFGAKPLSEPIAVLSSPW